MNPKRHKTVWCQNWWFPCHYGFCPSEKAWRETLKRLCKKPKDIHFPYPTGGYAQCTTLENFKGRDTYIITVSESADKEANNCQIATIIVHEATHVWQHMSALIGEYSPSKEFEAYMLQHISGELIDAYCATRRQLFRENP